MEPWAIEYQLENSSPEYVFEWLKDHTNKTNSVIYDERLQLEESLVARNNKLVNLGVALYGSSPSIGYDLYINGDTTIKKACLAGTTISGVSSNNNWVSNKKILDNLITEWNLDLLQSLLKNENIDDEILLELFKKKSVFTSLTEEKWMQLIAFVGTNKRLEKPYDSIIFDGLSEYSYEEVFTSAWNLFDRVGINSRNLNVLCHLSYGLVKVEPFDMNLMDVINKWRDNSKPAEEDSYQDARERLSSLIGASSSEFRKLADSDDIALRRGYYKNKISLTPENIEAGFKKDGTIFLDAVIENESAYHNEDTRSALNKACWAAPDEHSYMDYPNMYNQRYDYWSKKHPEWFKDSFTGDIPLDDIEDPDIRNEQRAKHTSSKVNEIHLKLIGDRDESQPIGEYGENSLFYGLQTELEKIGTYLGALQLKHTTAWGWGIAGLAIGYIMGTY